LIALTHKKKWKQLIVVEPEEETVKEEPSLPLSLVQKMMKWKRNY
jgi:hypothetical protein